MPETLRSAFDAARILLRHNGIDTADLDARLLLQDVTGLDHGEIIADGQRLLSAVEWQSYGKMVQRRMGREPVSKIIGWREFYGRRFTVNADVLDPRPETETLVDLALGFVASDKPQRILDLGSGSGAIIVTLLAMRPLSRGLAVDLSERAVQTTLANAAQLGVGERLQGLRGAWFEGVTGSFDLVVSNPPYIASSDIPGLEADVRLHDPLMALDGGTDGLDCYRQIAAGLALYLAAEGVAMVEIGAGQSTDVTMIFADAGHDLKGSGKDLGGHVRVLAFGGPKSSQRGR